MGSGFRVQRSRFPFSFEFWFSFWFSFGFWFWCAVASSLSACSGAPHAKAAQDTSAATARAGVECTTAAPLSADGRAAASELERAIEAGPLFAAGGGRGSLASCRVAIDEGVVSLDYRFRDGGSVHATRDPRIESSEQAARFVAPPTDDPAAILKRAERAAFGDQGCGIDWTAGETRPATDERGAIDSVYRGDSCNCQARVRRDAGGRVVALTLRSAC